MENYFRYFPISEKDESWGLTVLNAGCTQIDKHSYYPPEKHPAHHYFNWKDGRVLHEYQLIYITKGSGIFESENCKEKITEGSIILLHPEERHRYKPDFETGWNEFWVGFKGTFMDNILTKEYFNPSKAVLKIGLNDTILNLFNDIIKFSNEEKSGYQPAISGAIIYILGLLHTADQQEILIENDIIEQIVNKARLIFRERVNEPITPKKVADELKVGYSWFRKVFKKYTGLAPGQYIIQLKIQKSKELLRDPSKRVKEIAFELHMDSSLYFSRLFKDKVGLTPIAYRKQLLKKHRF